MGLRSRLHNRVHCGGSHTPNAGQHARRLPGVAYLARRPADLFPPSISPSELVERSDVRQVLHRRFVARRWLAIRHADGAGIGHVRRDGVDLLHAGAGYSARPQTTRLDGGPPRVDVARPGAGEVGNSLVVRAQAEILPRGQFWDERTAVACRGDQFYAASAYPAYTTSGRGHASTVWRVQLAAFR